MSSTVEEKVLDERLKQRRTKLFDLAKEKSERTTNMLKQANANFENFLRANAIESDNKAEQAMKAGDIASAITYQFMAESQNTALKQKRLTDSMNEYYRDMLGWA
jgi:hypothetical protein